MWKQLERETSRQHKCERNKEKRWKSKDPRKRERDNQARKINSVCVCLRERERLCGCLCVKKMDWTDFWQLTWPEMRKLSFLSIVFKVDLFTQQFMTKRRLPEKRKRKKELSSNSNKGLAIYDETNIIKKYLYCLFALAFRNLTQYGLIHLIAWAPKVKIQVNKTSQVWLYNWTKTSIQLKI